MSRSISTGTIASALFALAVLLLPFDSLPYFQNILGEMANEGAFYPLAVALLLWGVELLHGRRIRLSGHTSAWLFGAFFIWVFISAAANLPSIVVNTTKGRTGSEKLLLQIVLLCFTWVSVPLVYELASRDPAPLRTYRRYLTGSFLIAGAYSILEIGSFAGLSAAAAVLTSIDRFIHASSEPYIGRVRSVSGEASWFAMYCSLVFPWLLSYLFTERGRSGIVIALLTYFIALVGLSWSRTAYVITTVQLMAFLGAIAFASGRTASRWRLVSLVVGAVGALAVVSVLLSSSLPEGFSLAGVFASLLDRENMSNVGRAGSQVAAYDIAMHHPVLGVGLGQFGFHMPAHVPAWAKVSDEIQAWMSPSEGTPWAPALSMYARIAAELGYVGLAIWVALWATALIGCWRHYRRSSRALGRQDILGLALQVSILGIILSGINFDSLRFFGYWITLGITWAYLARPVSDLPGATVAARPRAEDVGSPAPGGVASGQALPDHS